MSSFHRENHTIAAIATPPGEGAISIIRVSGKDTFPIIGKIFSGDLSKYKSHTAHYGKIIKNKEIIDHVLLLIFRSPRSYTGEDSAEIHCHGGSLITRKVLSSVLEAGAQPAKAGEFTFRAFINGKLDLTQAEAVQKVISAKGDLALKAAKEHLEGSLSKWIQTFQKNLTNILAEVEALIDFPEEDIEPAHFEKLHLDLGKVATSLKKLSNTFHNTKKIHEGLRLAIVGAPNAGKSSLMNCLLQKDRAIVSSIEGTTRDTLEEQFHLNGLFYQIIDTAGIRDTTQTIEQEGIKRAKKALAKSDFVLWVLDATKPLKDQFLSDIVPQRTIAIWNKIDLEKEKDILELPYVVHISAKKEIGIEKLCQAIDRISYRSEISKEEICLSEMRHKKAIDLAISACEKALIGMEKNLSPEFIAFDLRDCLQNLSEILGMNITEEVLSSIFSKFCIGK